MEFLIEQLQTVDLNDKPEGISMLNFIVTNEGDIQDIRVFRSLEPSLDQAAIDAVKRMPRWVPGIEKGQNVNVRFTIPVLFSKDNQQKTKTKQKNKN